MSNKRPVTYKDWRALWHSESKRLGWNISYNFCKNNSRIKMTRELWRDCHRVRRIEARLRLENEVRDSSWAEAMWEIIFPKELT